MNTMSRKFWGLFGSICAMVYGSIGLYYAVTSTVGKKFGSCIIGLIIFCVVLSYIGSKKKA